MRNGFRRISGIDFICNVRFCVICVRFFSFRQDWLYGKERMAPLQRMRKIHHVFEPQGLRILATTTSRYHLEGGRLPPRYETYIIQPRAAAERGGILFLMYFSIPLP